jgi:hypothetical protein
VPEENNYKPRIHYLAKLSFKNEDKIKTLSDNQRQIKFITSRCTLKAML